jgi:hypothetical protein
LPRNPRRSKPCGGTWFSETEISGELMKKAFLKFILLAFVLLILDMLVCCIVYFGSSYDMRDRGEFYVNCVDLDNEWVGEVFRRSVSLMIPAEGDPSFVLVGVSSLDEAIADVQEHHSWGTIVVNEGRLIF